MHPKAANAIVESVRRRERQGDCPTEPAHSVETLEDCILTLAQRPAPVSEDTARLLTAIHKACRIIELGDERLLRCDGPAGGQPPDLTLSEWRELYVTLDAARSTPTEYDSPEEIK